MKIFTSRYGNKALRELDMTKIGISLGKPRWSLGYEVIGNLYNLAPSGSMLDMNDQEAYRVLYEQRVAAVGVAKIRSMLEALGDGEDVVLLCYEDLRDGSKWCHRRMFAEWWEGETGEKV